MKFPFVSIGNNNVTPQARKSAVFGKRAAGKDVTSKAQARPAERTASQVFTAPQILAITVPLATALTSMTWAIATCVMVRERYRAQIELARFKAEANKQETISMESPLLMPGDRSISEQPAR